jgi:hypothetical protein
MEEEPTTTLEEQFSLLTEELRSYTSYKRSFLRGVVYGLGTAIGATIIAAVVLGGMYRIVGPFFGYGA